MYLFGDHLLVQSHTIGFPVKYSVCSDTNPKRLDLFNPELNIKQKAIYRVDETNLVLCTTGLLENADELDYPATFQPVKGSRLVVSELERIPVSLADVTTEGLPSIVTQYCEQPDESLSAEEVERLKAIWAKHSQVDEEKIWKAAKLIGERVFQHDDYADCYHQEMLETDRIPFAISWLLTEVNNGGFDQYLHNGTGAIAADTLIQLGKIGATKTAELLREVLSLFPNSEPSRDMTTRRTQLEGFNVEQQERLSELDDLFYALEEDINALAVKYLQL